MTVLGSEFMETQFEILRAPEPVLRSDLGGAGLLQMNSPMGTGYARVLAKGRTRDVRLTDTLPQVAA